MPGAALPYAALHCHAPPAAALRHLRALFCRAALLSLCAIAHDCVVAWRFLCVAARGGRASARWRVRCGKLVLCFVLIVQRFCAVYLLFAKKRTMRNKKEREYVIASGAVPCVPAKVGVKTRGKAAEKQREPVKGSRGEAKTKMSMQGQSDQTARGQRSCSPSSCSQNSRGQSACNGSSHSRFLNVFAQWEASSNGQLCAVLALAGFCGALLRFFMQSLPLPWVDGFPLSTIVVNTLGSFLIVVVFCAGQSAHLLSPALVKVLNRGFLGAFTTLSAVCVDADELLAFGNDLGAFLYVALTLVMSFGAALADMRLFGMRKTFLAQDATAANVLCASLTEAGERL